MIRSIEKNPMASSGYFIDHKLVKCKDKVGPVLNYRIKHCAMMAYSGAKV
jgi:hypothetical protein